LGANIIKKLIDYFLGEKACNEVEHGVIENDDISLDAWRRALDVFKEKHMELTSMKVIRASLSGMKNIIKYPLAYLLGGAISGTCRKEGKGNARGRHINELLACPSCLDNGQESKLTRQDSFLNCEKGIHRFPIIDGVSFLFTDSKFKELYPELFRQF
jgi:uncharacterized protein YbaR (Trm112 family)